MQEIFETVFDILYLGGVFIAGIIMIIRSRDSHNSLLFKVGVMSVILASGDSFHLVPRAYALWTTGLEANAAALGFGKFVTSITMTLFYILLYYIWRERYHITGEKGLTMTMWVLAIIRIALCLFPQNQWLLWNPSLTFGILRNIPFAIIGIIIIVIFAREVKNHEDKTFRFMPLAVALSFAFYVPVVLFSQSYPLVGMLMIPKTVAYAWIVYMGWSLQKENR